MAAANMFVNPLGSDSGAGTELDPFLTWTHSLSVATPNDVIEGADSIYNEVSFLSIGDDGITLQAENSRGVVIRNGGAATARVIHDTKQDLTLDGIILDAENIHTGCLTLGTASALNVTIIGGGFLNPTANFFTATRMNNITMSGGWTASAASLSHNGFHFSYDNLTSDAGTVSITDGTMIISDSTAGGESARRGINVDSITLVGTGVSCNISDVSVTMGIGTTTNSQAGIYVRAMASENIYNNTVTISDSLYGWGIHAEVSGVDNTDTVNIYNNEVICPSGSLDGIGIQCGSNEDASPTGVGSLKNARVFNNTITGANHGVFVGWITDAKMYGNLVTDSTLGCISKGATTCKITGNVVVDCIGSGGLLAKGDTDSTFANNLVITNPGVTTVSMIAGRVSVLVNSIGTVYTNNILFNNGGTVTKFVNYAVSQTATFFNNNYYSNAAIPTNSWVYAGANVADIAAWQALGVTTDETNIDPELVDSDNGNYLTQSAALLNGGYNWGVEMYLTEDYLGFPPPAFDITVGAVQGTDNTSNPFACHNL